MSRRMEMEGKPERTEANYSGRRVTEKGFSARASVVRTEPSDIRKRSRTTIRELNPFHDTGLCESERWID